MGLGMPTPGDGSLFFPLRLSNITRICDSTPEIKNIIKTSDSCNLTSEFNTNMASFLG